MQFWLLGAALILEFEAEKWLLEAQEIFEDMGERRLRGAWCQHVTADARFISTEVRVH